MVNIHLFLIIATSALACAICTKMHESPYNRLETTLCIYGRHDICSMHTDTNNIGTKFNTVNFDRSDLYVLSLVRVHV